MKLLTGINQKQVRAALARLRVCQLNISKKLKYMCEPKVLEMSAIAKIMVNSAKCCTTPIPAEGIHREYILVLLKVLHCLFSVGFISTELAIFTFLL